MSDILSFFFYSMIEKIIMNGRVLCQLHMHTFFYLYLVSFSSFPAGQRKCASGKNELSILVKK